MTPEKPASKDGACTHLPGVEPSEIASATVMCAAVCKNILSRWQRNTLGHSRPGFAPGHSDGGFAPRLPALEAVTIADRRLQKVTSLNPRFEARRSGAPFRTARVLQVRGIPPAAESASALALARGFDGRPWCYRTIGRCSVSRAGWCALQRVPGKRPGPVFDMPTYRCGVK